MKNTGASLEEEVFHIIEKMIDDGSLPYQKDLCRLHRKKSYYSSDREGYINFENVLEVFVRENVNTVDAKPTHVIVFECKDHKRSVEVGKVDELIGRIRSSLGFSIKGYIATRHSFSTGALNTAKIMGSAF